MATIHVRDIMKWLADSGHTDAQPWSGEFFLEIRFDEPGSSPVADVDLAGKVITSDTAQGTVPSTFDDNGRLRSLDIS
jgi:hypothetical protein